MKMRLGEAVRKRRKQLELTQEQLALRVGISKPYLSNVETERAKNPPSDPVVIRLERELGFYVGELLRVAHIGRSPADVRQENEMLTAEVDKLRILVRQLKDGKSGVGEAADLLWAHRPPSPAAIATGLAAPDGSILHSGMFVPVINSIAGGYPRRFTGLDHELAVADEYARCPDVHDARAFAIRVVGDAMEPRYHEGDIVVFSPASELRDGDDCFVVLTGEGASDFKRIYHDDPHTARLQPLNYRYPGVTYPREQVRHAWPAVSRIEKLR